MHGAVLGIDVEIVAAQPAGQGFVPQPQAVDGRADLRHPDAAPPPGPRLRAPPASSASRVYWAMTHVMTRRLTGTNTPTWRDGAGGGSVNIRAPARGTGPPGRRRPGPGRRPPRPDRRPADPAAGGRDAPGAPRDHPHDRHRPRRPASPDPHRAGAARAPGLPPHPRRLQRVHRPTAGQATSAKPSTTNCCRRTSKAPAPS